MGMVRFGLKNVKYAEYDTTNGTYGEWKSIPGAVSLTASFEGSNNDFYADDVVYAVISATSRESGTIEFAAMTKDIYEDIFGYAADEASGLEYMKTDPVTKTFALGYEVSGNEKKQRGVRYNVTFTNPNQDANTMTDSTNPDTVSCDFTAIGRDFTVDGETVNVLKAHVDEGGTGAAKTAYDNFFTKVQVPGVSSAGA